tara:strand:+ start:4874 stop:5194 length:321 start_codon:yes stop_codon:yes gene_type:complete
MRLRDADYLEEGMFIYNYHSYPNDGYIVEYVTEVTEGYVDEDYDEYEVAMYKSIYRKVDINFKAIEGDDIHDDQETLEFCDQSRLCDSTKLKNIISKLLDIDEEDV